MWRLSVTVWQVSFNFLAFQLRGASYSRASATDFPISLLFFSFSLTKKYNADHLLAIVKEIFPSLFSPSLPVSFSFLSLGFLLKCDFINGHSDGFFLGESFTSSNLSLFSSNVYFLSSFQKFVLRMPLV